MKTIRAIAFFCLCFAGTSCERPGIQDVAVPKDPSIIATVGTEQLTLSEFEAELNRRSRGLENTFASPAAREKLLAEMIRSKAALARARASGFDQQPEVVRLVEELIVSRYLEQTLGSRQTGELQIGDDAVSSHYERHLEEYKIAPAVRAGIIVLEISAKATAEKREVMRRRAEMIRGEALQANDERFKQLVRQHSRDQSTRYIGGNTGWLNANAFENRWPAEVVDAALALVSPGDVAPVIETTNNFFIIRLNERREASVRPLTEVADAIRYQLLQSNFQQQRDAVAHDLTNGLAIHVNQEAIAKAKPVSDATPLVPPSLPD